LLWRDDYGLVVGLRARLDMQHGILRDMLVPDADLVNAAHGAPHLRNRRPGKTARLVEASAMTQDGLESMNFAY